MIRPIDLVLARLDDPKPTTRDRWRSSCPACRGNKSALSVGIGNGDTVLIQCFKGCDVDAVVAAMGLQLHDLFPPKLTRSQPLRRRAMLTAGQALDVIALDCMLTWTAAFNLANGHALTADDLDHLMSAGKRIQWLASEVRS